MMSLKKGSPLTPAGFLYTNCTKLFSRLSEWVTPQPEPTFFVKVLASPIGNHSPNP